LFFLFCRAGLVGGDPEHLGDPDLSEQGLLMTRAGARKR